MISLLFVLIHCTVGSYLPIETSLEQKLSIENKRVTKTSAKAFGYENWKTGIIGQPQIHLFSLIITKLIRIYQKVISPHQGDVCNFTPSCSNYAYEAIKRHGLRGVLMTFDRLERCNYFAWHYKGKYYKVKLTKERVYKLHDPVDNQ